LVTELVASPTNSVTRSEVSFLFRVTATPIQGMDRRITTHITLRASGQYGLITLEQLAELGMTRQQLRTLVGDVWLLPMAPWVYGIAGAPPSIERRLMLGLLSLGPSAVVSHEAVARLHGFDRCLPDAVEFSVPRGCRHARGPFRVHSTRELPPIDRVSVDGFRCTSATRTIIDLARARITTVRLEAAIDSAARAQLISPVVLDRRLAALRGPGRWGAPKLDELLLDSGGHTLLKRRFLQLMRRANLPRPRTQVVHRRSGRTFARVDFILVEQAVVVEVSGRKGHASDAERARDAQRRNELQDVGRRVYEYTYHQVMREPEHVIETMRLRFGHQIR
jgi:very-short-patch-repair endonuclease